MSEIILDSVIDSIKLLPFLFLTYLFMEWLEVIAAIRNNVCRCTGYKKIIEAILLSARILREGLPVEEEQGKVPVGMAMQRIDAREKVLGTGE